MEIYSDLLGLVDVFDWVFGFYGVCIVFLMCVGWRFFGMDIFLKKICNIGWWIFFLFENLIEIYIVMVEGGYEDL